MTTLESRINERLEHYDMLIETQHHLQQKIDALEADLGRIDISNDEIGFFRKKKELELAKREYSVACSAQEDKLSFLLDSFSFIREYMDEDKRKESKEPESEKLLPQEQSTITNHVKIVGETNKRDIFLRYVQQVEKVPTEPSMQQKEYVCTECNGPMFNDDVLSSLVCQSCGITKQYLNVESGNLSYDEELLLDKRPQFCYKRLTHFSDYLASVQGRENTEISEDVLDQVRAELKKYRYVSKGDITTQRIKRILKKLSLSRFYEHTQTIVNLINKVPSPRIPMHIEQQLKNMFLQIQAPFAKACPKERKNFLSYGYVLFQLCRLLGSDAEEFLPLFPLLRSSEKLRAADTIWKQITEELNWDYYPTV
jgi:Poxvirus Late Transcription Factor VLTF3 like